MSSLYVPGRGMVNLSAMRVDSAVSEYDERLLFGQHPENGQWCIFIKMGYDYEGDNGIEFAGSRVIPIQGFDDIPHPDDALKRLYQSDSLRWGEEMLDKMNARNDAIKAELEEKASEGTGHAAEVIDWFKRNEGQRHAPRVFFPGDK